MSTLQATNLKHGSSASNNLVLDANGNVTAAGTVAMASPFAMRNKIINGAMEIDQRNAGASVTPTTISNGYPVDRFLVGVSQNSKLTCQQSTVAPTGYINSFVVTSSTAYSVLSSDFFWAAQYIEGLNTSELGWGTASAKAVTLSFWVRSSLTGQFGAAISNSNLNRSYAFSYTISAANTWEQKTVTIPGDITGTWLTTNGIGIRIFFNLGAGSAYLGTAETWAASNLRGTTGDVSVVATNGATWYLTGVQLEVGSVATPFERRLYPQELALCQRYYQTGHAAIYGASTAAGSFNPDVIGFTSFNATMRAAPTITRSSVTDTNGNAIISSYTNGIKITFDITSGNVGGTQFNFAAEIEL